jgi:hypothetical protein
MQLSKDIMKSCFSLIFENQRERDYNPLLLRMIGDDLDLLDKSLVALGQ